MIRRVGEERYAPRMSCGKKRTVICAFVGTGAMISHKAVCVLGPSSVDNVAIWGPVKYLKHVGGGGHEMRPKLIGGKRDYDVGFRGRDGKKEDLRNWTSPYVVTVVMVHHVRDSVELEVVASLLEQG